MLHGRNNANILHMKELLFPWKKESFVPAMQHGCRAKPLYAGYIELLKTGSFYNAIRGI